MAGQSEVNCHMFLGTQFSCGQKQRFQKRNKIKPWHLDFCWFFCVIHKALAHDSPLTSMYNQGTEASLLELHRFMALGGLGVRDPPNTTGWPPP